MTSLAPEPVRARLRRWAPWVILAVVLIAVLAVGVQRRSHPSLEQRTMHIAGQVRCPVCAGQSAAQSDTPASLAIRDLIRQKLQGGEPSGQVLGDLVGSYGPSILERPEVSGVSLLVWVVPIVVVAAAVAGLALAFARWRPRGQSSVTAGDRMLVARELDRPADSDPGSAPADR